MWLVDYFEDIASDLSAFHRIDPDKLGSMPADEFVRLAERLWYYPGVMQARVAAQQARLMPRAELPAVPAAAVVAGAEVVDSTRTALSSHDAFADLIEWG